MKEQMNEKLPPKVEQMYRAVLDMINEGSDVNTMKVQDITGRAGIGKGTAYEYFQSKEELIGEALDWSFRCELDELRHVFRTKVTFHDKIYALLDLMEDRVASRMPLAQLLTTSMGGCFVSHQLKLHQEGKCHPEMLRAVFDEVMEAGISEGVISADCPEYNKRTALISQVLMFFVYLNQEKGQRTLDTQAIKDIIYRNLLSMNQ